MITIDFETKSYADLTKVGAWVYSKDPTTEIICACYQIDDEPIQEWWPGKNASDEIPDDLRQALGTGLLSAHHISFEQDAELVCRSYPRPIEAHNISFERPMWMNVLTPRYGWPVVPTEQWRDTMAVAAYYALPASLDKLARVLGFGGKDPEGGRLITKYSKLYLKTAKPVIPEEDFRKFVDYCRRDVELERRVSDFLGDLPERELPLFFHDQNINLRGLFLDREGIAVASRIVDQRSEKLTREFRGITGLSPAQTAKLITWFGEQGLKLENMQAGTIEDLLEDGDLPSGPARRALEIRLEINKASTKKLDAMARNADPDDNRARWQTRYHGAQTGRTTGSGFQPLNLVRGWEKLKPEQLVRDIMYGDADYLDAVYGDATAAVSKASRHWIQAAPGNRLLAGDFVSVEAVILACLAGEQWKIDAFARKDLIYELMADKIHNLPPGTVTKDTHPLERFDGKTGELAFGYQGALNAWLKFDSSGRHTDERIIEICKAWRAEHPMVVALWAGLETAAIEAVRTGQRQDYRQIGFEVVDDWLSMIGPDGKRIWYYKPELRAAMPRWHEPEVKEDCADGSCKCRPKPQLTYMAQKFGQWIRTATYGGKLTENACQFVSRQYLAPAQLAVEEAGYPVILTVYDEILAEAPEGFGSVEEFEQIIETSAGGEWSKGWPIRVEAWEGKRYKK